MRRRPGFEFMQLALTKLESERCEIIRISFSDAAAM